MFGSDSYDRWKNQSKEDKIRLCITGLCCYNKVKNQVSKRIMLSSNELYITGLKIRWDSIAEDSYLKNIEAIKEIDEIRFHSPVTFFASNKHRHIKRKYIH